MCNSYSVYNTPMLSNDDNTANSRPSFGNCCFIASLLLETGLGTRLDFQGCRARASEMTNREPSRSKEKHHLRTRISTSVACHHLAITGELLDKSFETLTVLEHMLYEYSDEHLLSQSLTLWP